MEQHSISLDWLGKDPKAPQKITEDSIYGGDLQSMGPLTDDCPS